MNAIYNFKLGQGKSPSFFFFSDNKLLMLKTCNPSEKKLLFDANFLAEYFKYVMTNPETLLMKIFGCYEVVIGNREFCFILTENMVSHDKDDVVRCFDLKGSLLGRMTKVDLQSM